MSHPKTNVALRRFLLPGFCRSPWCWASPDVKREASQVPALQAARAPVDVSGKVVGFGLVSAGRGDLNGDPALELEFSRRWRARRSSINCWW